MKALLSVCILIASVQTASANVNKATAVAKKALKTSNVTLVKSYKTGYLFSRPINTLKHPGYFADIASDLNGENHDCELRVAINKKGLETEYPGNVAELGDDMDHESNYKSLVNITGDLLRVCDFH